MSIDTKPTNEPEARPTKPVYHAGPEIVRAMMEGLAAANRDPEAMLREEEERAVLAARQQRDGTSPLA